MDTRNLNPTEAAKPDNAAYGTVTTTLQTNPLLIDLVALCVLKFEDYETLKQCRLVCRQWKILCDPLLMKQSTFVFYDKKEVARSALNTPMDFPILFSSFRHVVNFSAFKFQYDLLTSYASEMYLVPNRFSMSQLEIYNNGTLALRNGNDSNSIDEILGRIGPNLRRLKVTANTENGLPPRLVVTLDKLFSIPQIELKRCKIILQPDIIKIAPQELKLVDFNFENPENQRDDHRYRGHGIEFHNWILMHLHQNVMHYNEVIAFARLSTLHIDAGFERFNDRYTLNFSDCVNIKNLTLMNVHINLDAQIAPQQLQLHSNSYEINGQTTSTILLNIYLSPVPIEKIIVQEGKADMKINFGIAVKELKICRSMIIKTVDQFHSQIGKLEIHYPKNYKKPITISTLPTTVEDLNIVCEKKNAVIRCPLPFSFPNLKRLQLQSSLIAISYFEYCPLLRDVSLSYCNPDVIFNVDLLPKTIKRLELCDIYKIRGDSIYTLDVLVMSTRNSAVFHDRSPPSDNIFHHLKAELVVFYCRDFTHSLNSTEYFHDKNADTIAKIKRTRKLPNVAIGPVKWQREESFRESIIATIVDKKAEYYILEGDTGKAITREEFNKLIPFNENSYVR